MLYQDSQQELLKVGDMVVVTADAGKLERSFDKLEDYVWDPVILNVLGKRKVVLDVQKDGNLIGLEEPEEDSGQPVWYYSREVLTKEAASPAAISRATHSRPTATPQLLDAIFSSPP